MNSNYRYAYSWSEAAKEYTDQSIKYRYEIQVECKAKDSIMLPEIEGLREFRKRRRSEGYQS